MFKIFPFLSFSGWIVYSLKAFLPWEKLKGQSGQVFFKKYCCSHVICKSGHHLL